jgi:hypothetical protein
LRSLPDLTAEIKDAINASMNGYIIVVRAGTYVENIDFLGKAITLKSEQGPDVTIIDGNLAGSVVPCQSGEDAASVLDGFTLTNGSASGMYNNYSSPTVTNCIFWNDTPDEIYCESSSPTVTFCFVQGGYSGTGNIDQDPLFMDPLNYDFHLTWASLCIDAGDNYAPSLPATDFEGDQRIFPGNGKGVYLVGSPPQPAIVDIGADEYCLLKRKGLK